MNLPPHLAESLAVLFLFANGCSRPVSEDRVTSVENNDPEMVAAIAKAKASLPDFWKQFEQHHPNESDFSLKVRFTDKNGTEYIWVSQLERQNGKLYGVINNYVQTVTSVRLGDRIPISNADVCDWLYTRNGKVVGNYTLRALFKKMTPEEVESCKKMLETP